MPIVDSSPTSIHVYRSSCLGDYRTNKWAVPVTARTLHVHASRLSAVRKKALSEDEIEEVDELDEDERNEQLAIYWCAKEAASNCSVRQALLPSLAISHSPRGEDSLQSSFS